MANLLFPSAARILSTPEAGNSLQHVDTSFPSFKTEPVSKSPEEIFHQKIYESSESCQDSWVSEEENRDSEYKKNKKKRKKKHKKKEKKKSKHKKRKLEKPNTIWIENTNLDIADAYREDKLPDMNNYEFQGLYKMDIAIFHSYFKFCLGMNHNRIQTFLNDRKNKKKKADVSDCRYFNRNKSKQSENYFVEEDNNFQNEIEDSNFMPLKNLSFNEKGVIPLQQDGTISSIAPSENDYHATRNKDFSQKLLSDPQNITVWKEFIKYQDECIENIPGFASQDKLKRVITEKKLSILEKALLKNPTSIELIILKMNLANELWTPENIMDTWKKIIFQFPNKAELWMEYLDYLQNDILQMKVSTILENYRKSFKMLIGIIEGTIRSHQKEENAIDKLFLLFLQMAIFLWKAGHTEKVVCMLSSLIEFNVFTPSGIRSDIQLSVKKEEFEKYFEGPLVRFGGSGSCGWRSFADSKNIQIEKCSVKPISYNPHQGPNFNEKINHCQENNIHSNKEAWGQLEILKSQEEFKPYEGVIEECEDTDRIILYDDISFMLFNLPNESFHFQLILSYLFLLGVPIEQKLMSQHILNKFSKHFIVIKDDSYSPCYCHFWNIGTTHAQIISLLYREKYVMNCNIVSEIRNIFSQSIRKFSNTYQKYLSQIWLHFESVYFRTRFENLSTSFDKKFWKEHRKFVKELFKLDANRNNIALWILYAKHEWNTGNEKESVKIFLTTLKLCRSFSTDEENGINNEMIDTIKAVIDCQISIKDKQLETLTNDTKNIILNLFQADVSELSEFKKDKPCATILLKTSTYLKNKFYAVLSKKIKISNSCNFFCCYIVFQYFFNNIDIIIDLYDEMKEFYLQKRNESFDEVFMYILLFLQLETKSNYKYFIPYKKILEEVASLFPLNHIFNDWFIAQKQNGLNSLYARRYYEQRCKETTTIYPWLNYLNYEKKRLYHTSACLEMTKEFDVSNGETSSGIYQRIKHLYERIVEFKEYEQCSEIWAEYISFLLKQGRPKQAVDVFNRALTKCCGSKNLCIVGCEKLDMFDEIYKFMEEKEIRIKLLLEELDILLER